MWTTHNNNLNSRKPITLLTHRDLKDMMIKYPPDLRPTTQNKWYHRESQWTIVSTSTELMSQASWIVTLKVW